MTMGPSPGGLQGSTSKTKAKWVIVAWECLLFPVLNIFLFFFILAMGKGYTTNIYIYSIYNYEIYSNVLVF